MPAGKIGLRISAAISGVLILLGWWAVAPGKTPERLLLSEPRFEREREVVPGEVDVYPVELSPHVYLRVLVEQRGSETELAVAGPEGRELLVVDSPTYRQGTEKLMFEAPAGGTYQVEVRSRTRGRYLISIETAGPGAGRSEELVAAELAETTGARLHHEASGEARRRAAAEYRRALAFWQKAGQNRDTARILHHLGALHGDLEEIEEGLGLLEQALGFWRSAGDALGEASTHHKIGQYRERLGESSEAAKAYRRALALRQTRGDRCGEAETENNLALIDLAEGRSDEARVRFGHALTLCDETGDPNLAASLLMNLGALYQARGDLEEAISFFGRSRKTFEKLGDRHKEAVALNNLGMAYRSLGEYQKALDHYRRSRGLAEELGDGRLLATVLNNLGVIHLKLGEPRRALESFEELLPRRRLLGDRRGETTTLHNLGQAHQDLGEAQKALELYCEALAGRREIGDRRGQITTLLAMGSIRTDFADFEAARSAFSEALKLSRQAGNPLKEAQVLRHLAELRLAAVDPASARDAVELALELHRRWQDPVGEASTLPILARAARQAGELEAALVYLEDALDLIESLRIKISAPDLRASFLASQREAYESTIDLLMELHGREPTAGHDRRALEISERSRARSLLEILDEAGRAAPCREPDLLKGLRSREERLTVKAEQRLRLLDRGRDAEAAAMAGELQELLDEIEDLEAEIRRRDPKLGALRRPRILRAEEIRRLLDPETLLVEYSLGQRRSFLWAVTADSVTAFELPPREVIEAAARDLFERWSTLDIRGRQAETEVAAALSRELLAPVARRLKSVRRLAVVADGALHYVPFAALPCPGPGGGGGEPLPPLVAGHEVVHWPSASVLAVQRRESRTDTGATLVIVADPLFEAPGLRPSSESALPARSVLVPLPGSRFEAETLAALAPPGATLELLGSDASRKAVTSGLLDGYRYVHFATHGVLDSERPRLSGLMLSRFDGTGRQVEGFLSLQDIYNLRLDAELVVLSGCRTARGKEIRGEGLVGLTRGFMYAGARRVVASLWRVQDKATAELMSRFYRGLLVDRLAPSAALSEAQYQMWRTTEWADPYYWAAFVHQGDWG